MDDRKFIFQETLRLILGQVLCIGLMFAVFALLGYWSTEVLIGGILGGLLSAGNFFFMGITTSLAADKAQAQNVKGGKATITGSYLIRMLVLFILLFALVKSGICHVLALVLPLAFVRPILTIGEFFRRKGDATP